RVAALASGVQEVGAGSPRVGLADDAQIVGRATPPITRRFFNFVAGGDEQEFSIGKSSIGKEGRALLQEALYDLLECKRLL
ncbi:MerR family transcriptional regulator, partial [Rhizobium ruizarguesonis]